MRGQSCEPNYFALFYYPVDFLDLWDDLLDTSADTSTTIDLRHSAYVEPLRDCKDGHGIVLGGLFFSFEGLRLIDGLYIAEGCEGKEEAL